MMIISSDFESMIWLGEIGVVYHSDEVETFLLAQNEETGCSAPRFSIMYRPLPNR